MQNAYSNQATITIACGGEQISVNSSSFQFIKDKDYSTFQLMPTTDLSNIFSSDVANCPITKYEIYQSSALSSIMTASPYFILNDGNDISKVDLSVRLNVPFRATTFLKAETAAGIFNYVEIEVIVCGNELLSAKPIPSDSLSFPIDPGSSFSLDQTTLEGYFSMSYDKTSGHSSCSYINEFKVLEA